MGLDMSFYKTTKSESYKYDNFSLAGDLRKANHIHKWMVDNCQGGLNDGRYTIVSKEKLMNLKSVCAEVLQNKGNVSFAQNALPRFIGTFGWLYGHSEYNDFYYDDVNQTIEIVDNILKNTDFEKEVVIYSSTF